ncbi:MAG: PAS domain S-box protein, partial [Bacteroidota bacterium]
MDSQLKSRNIPRHLILVFILLAVGIGGAGYLYYENQKKHIKEDKWNELSGIADLKVSQIINWRKERAGDAAVFFEDPIVARRVEQFLESPKLRSESRKELLGWMKSWQRRYQDESIFLLDARGKARLSVGAEREHLGPQTRTAAAEVMRTKKLVFSDLQRDEISNHIDLDLLIPLLVQRGRDTLSIGVFVLRIDPYRFLYPLVQSWPTLSRTSETLLIRRESDEVVYLNELRHRKNTALSLQFPVSEERLPAALAVRGQEGIVEGVDYRLVPVLAAMRRIPDSPWFLVAKVDIEEVYGPIRESAWFVGIFVSVLIVAAGVSVGAFWRGERAQFYRKQYEGELERQALAKHYEYLVKYANDIILLMDDEGKIVEANDRAVAAYGYTHDELLQLRTNDFEYPGTRTELDGQTEYVIDQDGKVFETMHRRKDGVMFPVEVSSRIIDVDGKKFDQSIVRDISERKRAEHALHQSEERFRALIENSSDGVALIDSKGSVLYQSSSVSRLLGYSVEEFIGRNVFELVHPDDLQEAERLFAQLLQRPSASVSADMRYRHKDGSWRCIEGLGTNLLADPSVQAIVVNYRDITERRRAEEQIRFQASILDQVHGAAVATDLEGKIIYWNKFAERVYGWRSDEVIGKPGIGTIVPTAHERRVNELRASIDKAGEWEGESEFQRKDGAMIPVYVRSTLLKDSKGKAIGRVGVSIDITERKRAEEALRQSELQFRILAEQSPNMIFINKKGKVVYANKKCEEIMRYRREEFLSPSFNFLTLIAPESLDSIRAAFSRHLRDEEVPPYEYSLLTKDGKRIEAIIATGLINYGGESAILGVVTDITERRRAEVALHESETKYRQLIEQATDGIFIADQGGRLLLVNPKSCEMLGYTSDELLRLNILDTYPVDERNLAVQRMREVRTGKTLQFERRMRRKEGTFIPVEVSLGLRLDGTFQGIVRDITERSRAEEALKESEKKYRALVDNAIVGVYKTNLKGEILYVNEALSSMLEFKSPEELGFSGVLTIYKNLKDREVLLDILRQKGKVNDFEVELVTNTGKSKYALLSAALDGDVISGMVMDITDRHRAEQAERKLLSAVEQSDEVIYMTELDGTITYVNPAFEKVYGFTRDETIGKTPRILKSGILAQEHYEEFWNTLLSGKSIRDEFVNKTKDGRLITVGTSVNPVFSTQGAMIGFIAVQEDITESKRIEAALAHERTLLRTLIDNLPDYIYVKDTESRFILNNVAITHLLGASTPTEIVGRRDSDFFPRKLASQYYTDEQGIIRSGQPLINREETLIDAAGNRRWVLTTKVPLRDGDGKIVGIVGMNRDITERKQLEQQLLQAQKMESVGTLAGGIAHDFNNILGIILGHTTLLKEAIADSAKTSKSLMAIKKAVQRGVSLVEQLLTFARKADVQFQSVRLNDVIEDLVRLVEETFPKSIKFALQFDEQIPSIVGDPNQIHQALLNLLINARDAMLVPLAPGSTIGSNGGILSIKTETLVNSKMREFFPDAREEQYVCVRVAD